MSVSALCIISQLYNPTETTVHCSLLRADIYTGYVQRMNTITLYCKSVKEPCKNTLIVNNSLTHRLWVWLIFWGCNLWHSIAPYCTSVHPLNVRSLFFCFVFYQWCYEMMTVCWAIIIWGHNLLENTSSVRDSIPSQLLAGRSHTVRLESLPVSGSTWGEWAQIQISNKTM